MKTILENDNVFIGFIGSLIIGFAISTALKLLSEIISEIKEFKNGERKDGEKSD